ncbi:MAG: hypothetical protein H6729_10870 [Deltaproteobacteria bacterium]|nr:hypothetical protein [Deltaproteobacteria bacterium]
MTHQTRLSVSLVALCLLSIPTFVRAQPLDLMNLRSEYLPPTVLQGDRPGGAAPWSNADDVQVSTYVASLKVPLSLGDGTVLAPGFGYRLDKLSFSHESPNERELNLYAFEVSVTLIHLISPDWMLLFQAAPSLAGDLHRVESRALRMQGLGLVSYQLSDGLVLGGGAAAMFEFGSLLPLPVLYAHWEPIDGIAVDVFFPLEVEAKLSLGDRFEVGVRADVDGYAYAMSDPAIRSAAPCSADVDDPTTPEDEAQAGRDDCIDHVAYSVATAGASFGARIVDTLWLDLYVGHTFYRRLEQMNADNERVAGGLQTLPDAFFGRVGLTWRLPDDSGEDA